MTSRNATPRQIAFLRSLLEQILQTHHVVDPDNAAEATLALSESLDDQIADPEFSTSAASKAIDDLKSRLSYLKAKAAVVSAREGSSSPVEPGFYIYNDDVYVVVHNRAKTNVYAKRMNLVTGSWEYAPGAVSRLSERLTVEQAAAMGHLHGICVCCGATLTDPESVERGIGPVCAKRLPTSATSLTGGR
jgi:hypothetical protein